jgi:paraquat-inducible protein A
MNLSHFMNQPLPDPALVACPNCDLVQRLPEVEPGASVRCPRCDTELWRRKADSINRTMALALSAAVLWIITNTMPMLGLRAAGHEAFTTVIRGAELLWQHGEPLVATVVFFTVVAAPVLQIAFVTSVTLGSLQPQPPAWVGFLLRYVPFTRIWSMMEVLLVGVLVSLTKIAEYATVLPGHALFTVGGLVVVLTAMQASFDPREIWLRVEWARDRMHSQTEAERVTEAAS